MKNAVRIWQNQTERNGVTADFRIWNSRLSRIVLLVGLLTLNGCGQGFQTSSPSCSGSGCNAPFGSGSPDPTGGGGATDPQENEEWRDLRLEGAISGGRYAQTPVIQLDKENKLLKVKLPMIPNPYLILSREIQIAEIKGAKISWETMSDGTVAMVLSLPLDQYVKGLNFPQKDKLPNGEDLPGIAGGELPSIAIGLVPGRDIKATIYLGASTVAVFVNTPFDPVIRTPAIPIRDQTQTRTLGYFAIIPEVGNFDGGFFVSAAMPADIAAILDDVF